MPPSHLRTPCSETNYWFVLHFRSLLVLLVFNFCLNLFITILTFTLGKGDPPQRKKIPKLLVFANLFMNYPYPFENILF